MRKHYLDNIRWITVVLVVIYHVIYMYNGVQPFGVIGPFQEVQYQDAFQYVVYPWFMALLFVVSGMSARYELETRTAGEVIRRRTRKLLVPSTIGLFVFQWILGYYNMAIGGGTETMFSAMPIRCLRRSEAQSFILLWRHQESEFCGIFKCCGSFQFYLSSSENWRKTGFIDCAAEAA